MASKIKSGIATSKEVVEHPKGIEQVFDVGFASQLSLREKQIQQNYRPIIGIHKWFARRPGTTFRSLILSEYSSKALAESFWESHSFEGVIADPFMGGGTPLFEANRLGFHTVGTDINPMAYWVVRQSLQKCDLEKLKAAAEDVILKTSSKIKDLYQTTCEKCNEQADVKYFLWVKTTECPSCSESVDLFPGYLLAEDERHPLNVIACSHCGELNECKDISKDSKLGKCTSCKEQLKVTGTVSKKNVICNHCEHQFRLPLVASKPYEHRLWAIEYHCSHCYSAHEGRLFKRPDENDLARYERSKSLLKKSKLQALLPDDDIPAGDETDRLLKWGYRKFRDLFNDRQLLSLATLLNEIMDVQDVPSREALLTVFSDFLRYQNMLCRYDTYALKCQDIFSVHGFPVGLVQCENNVLGIPKVGSGAFRHFIQKYIKAKEYCLAPFETKVEGKNKKFIYQNTETILANLVDRFPRGNSKEAWISCNPSWNIELPKNSLDGVFTDPPYFDNVQYAELMDFCYHWLKHGLKDAYAEFKAKGTRAEFELTGNTTAGRGIEHFTSGMSKVFRHFSNALKPNAPFVFTYHHNDPLAYSPLVVAILDSGMECTATLPAAAEMSASLHIAGTSSSVMDSVFVCRARKTATRGKVFQTEIPIEAATRAIADLDNDVKELTAQGLKVTEGDKRCLYAGHIARHAIAILASDWNDKANVDEKLHLANTTIRQIIAVSNEAPIKHQAKSYMSDASI